jgi:hypothetical protein
LLPSRKINVLSIAKNIAIGGVNCSGLPGQICCENELAIKNAG